MKDSIEKSSKAADMPANDIAASASSKQETFDWFKSEVCHEVKRQGELKFIAEILSSNIIRSYYIQKRYERSLYLLAMVDYLSRKNDLPVCSEYNDIRHMKFAEPIFPQSVLIQARVSHDDTIKTKAIQNAIPEFIRFNIVESEIEDIA